MIGFTPMLVSILKGADRLNTNTPGNHTQPSQLLTIDASELFSKPYNLMKGLTTMSKMDTIREIYREEGIRSVVEKGGKHVLLHDIFGRYAKQLLGDLLHQKSYMYFSLGYWPNIQNPRTFNEKIMNRKLYSDNSLFSSVEDKWEVREYVADKIGDGILPDIYHMSRDSETIPFDDLPAEYVIKPTHLAGGEAIIVTQEQEADRESIVEKCKDWLNETHGDIKGEYWYSEITPRIIVEEYIKEDGLSAPIDYKFMVFHGEVKFIHATVGRMDTGTTTRNFYDRSWNQIPVELYFPSGTEIPEPENLEKMIDIAEELGEPFDHIRVDLYSPGGDEVQFGEMTVAESSGENPFIPREFDFKFGSYW